ncbi:MAG: exo-alpha-sialidase [Verrucomicrobia bacterium]|nr:exo-alpha-sialidase [Verrucomicrobiota bacterium]
MTSRSARRRATLLVAIALVPIAQLARGGELPNRSDVHDLDPTPEHPRNTEGAFVTLRSGRILFDFSQFRGGQEDHSPSAIAEIYSDDQGRTWSEPRVVVPTGPYQNVMSVSLLRLASGRLARFYCVKRAKWLDCHPLMSISSDEGASWSEPRPVTTAPGYFVLNNDRVIQTTTGRLIVPLAFHRSRDTVDDPRSWDPHAVDLWFYSDDEGQTWHDSPTWWGLPVRSGSGLQEPGVVQLADGTLFGWARTDVGVQWATRSTDNGTTWSAPWPTDLHSPNSPASIKRLPDSPVLLAIFNDHSGRVPKPPEAGRRAPLVIAFSADGARTWGPSHVIEDDLAGWYCYTAVHFTGDAVLLAYTAGNDRLGLLSRLRLRRVPLADLPIPRP